MLSHIPDTWFSGRGQLEGKVTNYTQHQALAIKGTSEEIISFYNDHDKNHDLH